MILERAQSEIRRRNRFRDLPPLCLKSFVVFSRSGRAIGITHLTYHSRQEGVSLDYVRHGKVMGDGQAAVIGAKAPHPNDGNNFIDFFLSGETARG